MAKREPGAEIIGDWRTKTVSINGRLITLPGFIRDLTADAKEPGENGDILEVCSQAQGFSWGNATRERDSLSLACCFYLNVKWVMDRFFRRELQKLPQADMYVTFTNKELDDGYMMSEEMFAHEFTSFMKELGADPILDLDQEQMKPN